MKKTDVIKEVAKELREKIITIEDLNALFDQISVIENFLFKDIKTPLSEKLKGEIKEDLRLIVENLEKKGIIGKLPNEQFSFFEKIKSELKKFLLIKLEIAFEPSEDFLLNIKKWLKENVQQETVLQIKTNPNIVAGLIIEYQGKYLDLSLAKKIDEIIETITYERF